MRELLWVYVAGKVSDDNSSIQDVITQFRQAGFAISHDWTRASGIEKPYLEHVEWNRAAAEAMRAGVKRLYCYVVEISMALWSNSVWRFPSHFKTHSIAAVFTQWETRRSCDSRSSLPSWRWQCVRVLKKSWPIWVINGRGFFTPDPQAIIVDQSG